ncbi:MAG: Fe-S cluster assembly protein SufD [Frankiales bacterium]|nr:Fe-S cluster assembly protein SufD [Frankiales bacterium]
MSTNTAEAVEATRGGAHLERTYSRDVDDFPEPNSRHELWRFSALPKLRHLFSAPVADGRVELSSNDDTAVSTVGMDDKRVGSVFTPFDRIGAIAMQQATSATIVTVNEPRDEPIYLTAKGSGGTAYGHLLIDVAPFATATVIIDHVGAATYAANAEYRIGDGASLTVITVQDWDDGAIHVEAQTAQVGRDAKFRHVCVNLGGDAVRISPTIKYAGPGGDAELLGLAFVDAGQHVDARIRVDHEQPHCRSRVTYKTALQGKDARSVWTGDVFIHHEAVDTDTHELNRNLLLTDGARADSVPNLEIETGEVRHAGHASATGRFDDEQLFYLQSRGIPADVAKRMVVRAFFGELIDTIGVPALEDRLRAAIEQELEHTLI